MSTLGRLPGISSQVWVLAEQPRGRQAQLVSRPRGSTPMPPAARTLPPALGLLFCAAASSCGTGTRFPKLYCHPCRPPIPFLPVPRLRLHRAHVLLREVRPFSLPLHPPPRFCAGLCSHTPLCLSSRPPSRQPLTSIARTPPSPTSSFSGLICSLHLNPPSLPLSLAYALPLPTWPHRACYQRLLCSVSSAAHKFFQPLGPSLARWSSGVSSAHAHPRHRLLLREWTKERRIRIKPR